MMDEWMMDKYAFCLVYCVCACSAAAAAVCERDVRMCVYCVG